MTGVPLVGALGPPDPAAARPRARCVANRRSYSQCGPPSPASRPIAPVSRPGAHTPPPARGPALPLPVRHKYLVLRAIVRAPKHTAAALASCLDSSATGHTSVHLPQISTTSISRCDNAPPALLQGIRALLWGSGACALITAPFVYDETSTFLPRPQPSLKGSFLR